MTREEKLADKQREHRKLHLEMKTIQREHNRSLKRLNKHRKKLAAVGEAIYHLKHDGDTPEVTDHAVVRYLERVRGYNINELKAEVANHKLAKKEGNVVVTVNPRGDTHDPEQ